MNLYAINSTPINSWFNLIEFTADFFDNVSEVFQGGLEATLYASFSTNTSTVFGPFLDGTDLIFGGSFYSAPAYNEDFRAVADIEDFRAPRWGG